MAVPLEASRAMDWTSSELIGVAVILASYGGEPATDLNVYYRAWRKMQPQVEIALGVEGR